MRKLIIFVMALTRLVFLADAASARVIVLKGTYTQGQVDIACTRAGGGSTAGRGHGGFGCKTSKGEGSEEGSGRTNCESVGSGKPSRHAHAHPRRPFPPRRIGHADFGPL
jgi:hypothetical protein